jgi:hypothetical protein
MESMQVRDKRQWENKWQGAGREIRPAIAFDIDSKKTKTNADCDPNLSGKWLVFWSDWGV